MSRLGIHFPNAGFRNLDTLWSIPWGHFVVLHTNREWVPEIRLRFPQATILVRAYLENWATTEPLGWARSIAQWANELRPFGVELTFANEQNLEAEGHRLGARAGAEYPPASLYDDILRWDAAVIRELRPLVPWATIHFPALSQGHSDDKADAGYIGFEILREAVELCDVLDTHIYWDESIAGQRQSVHFGQRYNVVHALFPNKPIFVSEFGTAAWNGAGVADWIETLPDYVTGACWFIWDSDLKNQPWILRDQPSMVQSMRTFGLSSALALPIESIFSPVAIAERLIMSMSGFGSTEYSAAGGKKKAIGYGHVLREGDSPGYSVSEDDAKKLLRDDLMECLRELDQRAKLPLTANEKAALLSLLLDVGSPNLIAPLLDQQSASRGFDAASFKQQWLSVSSPRSPEDLRRRLMESSLFLRDALVGDSSRPGAVVRAIHSTPANFHISSSATWLWIKQGQRFHVVGIWYDVDSRRQVAPTDLAAGADMNKGEIVVRVEDDNGVGRPAELVVRRWNGRGGDCEPQLTDALGAARFTLYSGSEFSPRVERGPERIQVGDCVTSGLGVPIPDNGGPMPVVYFIRVRRNHLIS